jgi:hypothetical protein
MGSVLQADFRLSMKNKEMNVLSIGDRVKSLLGYASQDLLNRKIWFEQILHLNDAAKVRQIFGGQSQYRREF